jgi:hypothetical protein
LARPPHPLAAAPLTPAHVPAGSVWHHIFQERFPDPLGFGFGASRFSDPRKSARPRFGTYYVAGRFETAFLETIIRDRRNGNPGPLVMSAADLDDYVHVPVIIDQRLSMVDLRGGNAIALGLPTNTIRAAAHRRGQSASLAIYRRAENFDGIWYPSRLDGEENLAIYDRAVPKLSAGPRRKLGACLELAPILDIYRIALV